MQKHSFLFIAVLLLCTSLIAKETRTFPVPEAYKKAADAIIIKDECKVTIISNEEVEVSSTYVATILNKYGSTHGTAIAHYSSNMKVKKIKLAYYDKEGKKIKIIGKSGFEDWLATSPGTLQDDNRAYAYFETPKNYPYTVFFEYTYKTNSSLFLPTWNPIHSYNVAVMKSSFELINPDTSIILNQSKKNFKLWNVQTNETAERKFYSIDSIKAMEQEDFSTPLYAWTPEIKWSCRDFSFFGIKGKFDNWKNFGRWNNDQLLANRDSLPEAVKREMQALTKDAKTEREKISIVYKYMQDRSRYISLQFGIAGWKPSPASETHQLQYGDCKGLSYYTKALLSTVGIESHYTIVKAGSTFQNNIEKEKLCMQGNHAMLCVPLTQEADTVWLECTSNDVPAGYISGFTDDREVFLITPEGGKFAHTKIYADSLHKELQEATATIDETGKMQVDLEITSSGRMYGNSLFLLKKKDAEVKEYYKNVWGNQAKLALRSYEFEDNQAAETFHEHLKIEIPKYLQKIGKMLLIRPCILPLHQIYHYDPSLEKERSFYLGYTKTRESHYTIQIPEGFTINSKSLPENKTYTYPFGSYSLEITLNGDTLQYKRSIFIKKGEYPKTAYKEFVSILKKIKKEEQLKLLLQAKTL